MRWAAVALVAFIAHGLMYGFFYSPTVQAIRRAWSNDIFDRIDPREIAIDDLALIAVALGAVLVSVVKVITAARVKPPH